MTVLQWLRAIAAGRCSPPTIERVIDPICTDIDIESRTAMAEGRAWRSRWVRIAGYFALLKVVAFHACERTAHGWRAADRRTLARTVGFSAIAFAATALLALVTRPFARGWVLVGAAGGTCLAYYLLLFTADAATRGTHLPVVALVWLPNLVFAVASTALIAAARPRRPSVS